MNHRIDTSYHHADHAETMLKPLGHADLLSRREALGGAGMCGVEMDGFPWIEMGGFHGHGGTPIAGWFMLGKIPSRNG